MNRTLIAFVGDTLTRRSIPLILLLSVSMLAADPVEAVSPAPPEPAPPGSGGQWLASPWVAAPPPGAFRAAGAAVDLGGPHATQAEVVAAVQSHLAANPELLGGLDPAQDVEVAYSAGIRDMVYVHYRQLLPGEGLHVEGTWVRFSVKNLAGGSIILDTNVLLYPSLPYLLPPPSPRPGSELIQAAEEALGITGGIILQEKTLVRNVEARPGQGRWYRVYEARFQESPFTAVVDSDTAEVLGIRDDRLYAGGEQGPTIQMIQGTIRGDGVWFDPVVTGENLDTFDLEDLAVHAGGEIAYTDDQGFFFFPNLTTQTNVTAELEGLWADVTSLLLDDLAVSGLATPGIPLDLHFNPGIYLSSQVAQVNGYHHTTFVHDWVSTRLGGALPLLDSFTVPVYVNRTTSACNAYFDPYDGSINFYRQGERPSLGITCINAAYDTIIYHEYGHYVDAVGPLDSGGALGEGLGDMLATYVSGQPLIGENFDDQGLLLRTADNDYQYPADGRGEIHDVGQAWAGFAWHLRENLIASLGFTAGRQAAEDLVVPIFVVDPYSIPDAVWEVVLLDDADGDLSNGTPHLTEIADAASQHALFPFCSDSVTVISDPDMSSVEISQDTVPIIGTADPAAVYPGLVLQDYELFYGFGRDPGSWISFATGTSAVQDGLLGTWDFSALPVGLYSLRLVARTTAGLDFQFVTKVGIEEPITRLTTDPLPQRLPAISGRSVVWEDYRNGYGSLDIWRHDLATGVASSVTEAAGSQKDPDVSGDLVVWEDRRSDYDGDVYLFDLSTAAEWPLATGTWREFWAKVSGNLVVWEDYENGDPDVVLCEFDPATGQCPERWSTNHADEQILPAVSDNVVAWTDDRYGNLNVQACTFDPASGMCAHLFTTTDPEIQWYPHVSGPLVVWEDFQSDPGCVPNWWYLCDTDIYMRDGAAYRTIAISSPGPQIAPVVDSGRNLVAWSEVSEGSWDIFYCSYDPVAGTCPAVQLTADPGNQTNPAIHGDMIVWTDDRGGNIDVYLVNLGNDAPVFPPVPSPVDLDAGEAYSVDLTATDPDFDPVTYQVGSLPFGSSFDPVTHVFSWTPTNSQNGTHNITFSATDPHGASGYVLLSIVVRKLHNELVSETGNQTNPAVTSQSDGNLVVFEDDRHGDMELYLHDPSTGHDIRLSNHPAEQRDPFLYGRSVLWEDDRTGDWNIFRCLYDPVAETCGPVEQMSFPLTPIVNYIRAENPARSGDYIVWQGYRDFLGFEYDIWLFDLGNNAEWGITMLEGSQENPAVNGSLIAWQDNRNGDWDIYLCEYSTGSCPERRITTDAGDQRNPFISGSFVLWEDDRNGNWDIYYCIYDFDTGACPEQQFTSHPADQIALTINGGVRWIWQDNRDGDWDVFTCYYDFVTCPITRLTNHPANQQAPAISKDSFGDLVVWQDDRGGDWNLRYANFFNQAPVFDPIGDKEVRPNQTISFRVFATDPDGDPVAYSAGGLPSGAAFSPASQLFTWTPTRFDLGTHAVTFTAEDPYSSSSSETITITVRHVKPPDPPPKPKQE
jgi:beta propeller repeat protein